MLLGRMHCSVVSNEIKGGLPLRQINDLLLCERLPFPKILAET